MSDMLSQFVEATAEKFGIPGVAVGVWADGRETYASHGVTNVDNPLPVDKDTMFALASVTKTFTSTALMRLVDQGKVDLDAPVRRYVPELELMDKRAQDEITILNLLNHTSGLDWNVIGDTGDGDDGLARKVAQLAELPQIAPVGARASYSQAGYNLLGRVIENVTGLTYEKAIASLLFEPLGMIHSYFLPRDFLHRRFAVGHNPAEDGTMTPAPLSTSRGDNPGGGSLVSSVSDLIRWSQFHLGDGRSLDGTRLLPAELLDAMKRPTVELRGTSLGDALGICWFLRDVDGVRTIGHGGSSNGQFAELLIVPERNFAVVSVSNAGPNGTPANQAVVRWALEHYLGVVERDPEPRPYDKEGDREFAGSYGNDAMVLVIAASDEGLTLEVDIRPEIRAASDSAMPPGYPPEPIGMLPGDKDEFIMVEGGMKGQRGFFTRDESGKITGGDLAGRIFRKDAS